MRTCRRTSQPRKRSLPPPWLGFLLGTVSSLVSVVLAPLNSWATSGIGELGSAGSGLQAHCVTCGDPSPLGLKATSELAKLRSKIAREFSPKNIDGLRDMDGVREFILEKHKGQKLGEKVIKGFDRFREEMEFAALTFELPPAFLACLTYQESKFDSNAASSARAKGLLQLNTDGKNEVLNILNNGQKDRGPAFHSRLHDNWTNYHRLRLAELTPSVKKIASFASDPLHLTGIGGGSVLLSYYLDRMRSEGKSLSRSDVLNAAAAYNMGISKATRLCSSLSSRECTARLAREKSETRAHINSIDECMSLRPAPIR